MRVSRILVPAAASALLLTTLGAPATGADEPACRGLAATIVGEPLGTVEGTDGDDVIVTNGATEVDAGGGDDTICVTTSARRGFAEIDAAEGADVVDTTTVGHGYAIDTVLGAGPDELYGGRGSDRVHTGTYYQLDHHRDRVETGPGEDQVVTGEAGRVDTDDVDLGAGAGSLTLAGDRATGVLRSDPGFNTTISLAPATPGRWVIDDRADRASLDGQPRVAWANLRVSDVHAVPEAGFRFIGATGDDYVELRGHVLGVDLGAGDDYVGVVPTGAVRGSFTGGTGRDELSISSEEVLADLDRGLLGRHLDKASASIGGFEDLFVGADRAQLVGSAGPNVITVVGCAARIRGLGGNDRLLAKGHDRSCDRSVPEEIGIWAYGGPGNDHLRGSVFGDHLAGGPGRDRADGRAGSDLCRAEHRVECEA